MNKWLVPAFLAVIALGLALRLPQLRLRPMHNDEAVNAIKFRALWNDNNYKYDPNEFHGPTLSYFTLPSAWLNRSHDFNDFTEGAFRIVTVAFGVALIVLILFLTPDLGRAETLWACLFFAISPAMVFYSRYYIHEMPLVFFTVLAGVAAWRYCKTGGLGWCALAGAGVGLMWATKETFVFSVLSMALAGVSNTIWARWRGEPREEGKACWTLKSVAVAVIAALAVAMLFFSSFFKNPTGMADAFKTYLPWLHRAEGVSAHVHPWNFYFQRLLFYRANGGPIWSEGLIVALALFGFVIALTQKGNRPLLAGRQLKLARLMAFYTFWITLVYTLLPYKTTWCLLEFYCGMILLAGVGAAAVLRSCNRPAVKFGVAVLLAAATAQLGWQAWRGNFAFDKGGVPYCDTLKNPYNYSPTAPDISRLTQTVDALARVSPAGYGTVVEVMSPDSYWPLPWYLRRFKAVGFWDKIPAQPLAPIMIVSTALHAGFDEREERSHLMAGYFELRPNVFFELYVSVELWSQYIKTLPKDAK